MSIRKNALLKLAAVLVAASFMLGAAPAITQAAPLTPNSATSQTAAVASPTWHPALPPMGMGSVVWTDYMGAGDALTVDLGGKIYTVAPDANGIPGRLVTNLAPGTYTFTASIADVGTVNRTVQINAGQVIGLSFYGNPDIPTHGGGTNEQHYSGPGRAEHSEVNHNADIHVMRYSELLMSQEDLTAQAS